MSYDVGNTEDGTGSKSLPSSLDAPTYKNYLFEDDEQSGEQSNSAHLQDLADNSDLKKDSAPKRIAKSEAVLQQKNNKQVLRTLLTQNSKDSKLRKNKRSEPAVSESTTSKEETNVLPGPQQRKSLEDQEQKRQEWSERRMRTEQEKRNSLSSQESSRRKAGGSKRERKSERSARNKEDSRARPRSRGTEGTESSDKHPIDVKARNELQDKSSKMFAMWKSNMQDGAIVPVAKRTPSSRNSSGTRRTGTRPSLSDLHSAVFSPGSSFIQGELVVVPRTRGGLNYAKVDKKVLKRHCFFDSAVEHPTVLWKVIYNNNGKALCKELPAMHIGKLPTQTSNKEVAATEMDLESEGNQTERVVGAKPNIRDLDNVMFSSHCIFAPEEIVLVPRSAGGFTYGRLVKEVSQTCKMSDKPHTTSGWRVIVTASEDQANVNRKDLASACIGKIQLFSSDAQLQIPNRRAVFANFEQSTHSSELRMKRESEFAEDEEQATPESEGSSESEGGSEDENEIRPVALRRGASGESGEEFEDEIVLWDGNEKKSNSPPHTPPPPTTKGTSISAESPHKPANSKPELAKPPTISNVVKPQEPTRPVGEVTGAIKEVPLVTPDPNAQGGIAVPIQQIGGLLSVDKDELFKRLMAPNKSSSKKHLIVIDGPNVAKKHGKDTAFSSEGIKIVMDYWNRKGHDTIAFLPQHYVKRKPGTGPVTLGEFVPKASNIPLLLDLVEKGKLVLTPPQDYDDTYCIEYAMRHNGCIVTNDRYWDHVENQKDKTDREKREIKKWLREHLISFTFVRDEFMPNPNFQFPPL